MQAAEHYNAMTRARRAQQRRLNLPQGESHWSKWAHTYRFDPARAPEPLLEAALRYVESDDELIEIGGGAGRIGLPLARRAASLLNVEPSPAMREQFEIAAARYGAANAAALDAAWPLPPRLEPISADIVLAADVTYFIDDIEPFIRAMHASARRHVLILTWTVPPPNLNAKLFQIACGEREAPAPGFRQLLPVIRALGIAPEVQAIDEPFAWPERLPQSESEAIQFAIDEIGADEHPEARVRIAARIDDLFERGEAGGSVFTPAWRPPAQGMLITWTTDR